MSSAYEDLTEQLLRQCLIAWTISGKVQSDTDGALHLTAGTHQLRIARISHNPHFRWTVTVGERRRNVTGIAGLLRTVRTTIDPHYQPVRLRLSPLTLGAS